MIMFKFSILILLVAPILAISHHHPWRRRHLTHESNSDTSNIISFAPRTEEHSGYRQAPRALNTGENNEESEIDEAALRERLNEVYNNLADHILEETAPEHRFEVAKRLTEGSTRNWTSIAEFLQFWSKIIAQLKKENEARDKAISKDVEDEYDNDIGA